MTRLEYLTLRVLASYTGQEAPEEAIRFYETAGWEEDALDHYRARFGDFGKMLYQPALIMTHAPICGDRWS